MKNAFVFERDPLRNLASKLTPRLHGACLSIMRYLILEANYSSGWWNGKPLQRGQIFTGRNRICQETGLSPSNVRSSIALLRKLAELTSETTNEGTLYRLVNYDSYDGLSEKVTNEVTNDSPTTHQRLTTSKEEYKEEQRKDPPPKGGAPPKRPRDVWLDEMYECYVQIAENGTDPDRIPPKLAAVFQRWKRQYGPDLPIQLGRQFADQGKQLDKPEGYWAKAIMNEFAKGQGNKPSKNAGPQYRYLPEQF